MVKFNFDFLYRKKSLNNDDVTDTKLNRVLGIFDVIAIGISSTLGSGIYVLSGTVITKFTGPSVIISFIIAGIATFFSGICYAELGARVPRSGSAFVYIYVTIGELVAFIMGWDLILEYIIGTSSVANALSLYIDKISGNAISIFFKSTMPMTVTGLGPYPDFLAFGLTVVVTILMIVGVKESALLNKVFTGLNVFVLSFIIVCGATKVNFSNWKLNTHSNLTWIRDDKNISCLTSERCGKGGFFPFDFSGVIAGSAKCFYAYIGFDAIASTGEEVVNPKRIIPLSIIITLVVVATLYCCLSGVLTLMMPYYILDPGTPLPDAFKYVDLNWATYVVSIGAIVSLATCLYAGMFPMPRIVYAMSSDGLIYEILSKILPKLKTPYVASIVTGLFAAILATIFNLDELVDMLSIGTLMAYSLVSFCVLLLRYQPSQQLEIKADSRPQSIMSKIFYESDDTLLQRLISPSNKKSNRTSSRLVVILSSAAVIFIIALNVLLSSVRDFSEPYAIALIIIFTIVIILFSICIWRQPQVDNITTFKAPLVPFLPLLSIFVNTYMMSTLSPATWARFIIWFVLGLIVYFTYGVRNSKENKNKKTQNYFLPCILREDRIQDVKDPDVITKL